LVSPHEDMAEKIVRHFKRIYFPRAEDVKISWPCEPDKVFPAKVGNIYDGDTLHVFGRFQEKPDGEVTLTAKLENGETFTQRLSIRETSFSGTLVDLPGTTARMAAASELRDLSDSKEIAALGVKYQLMTQHTNYLAIDVKAADEKAGDLPALRKTPQMLAAGWGGSGTVDANMMSVDYMEASRALKASIPDLDIQFSIESRDGFKHRNINDFIDAVNILHSGAYSSTLVLSSIQDLEVHGVPEDIAEDLIELNESGIEEHVVVVAFLYLLSQHERFKMEISRSLRRIIIKAYKQLPELQDEVAQKIEHIIVSNCDF
jgi:Ca-activated chloride channel family protein